MKRFLVLAALALVIGLAVAAYAGQPEPGSEADPLVTKGYVDNYVDQVVAELEKEISRLEKRVAQLEALVGQQGYLDQRELKLTIGSTTAYFNGSPQTIDAAPYLEGSTTMLPFKVVGDALGATVKWEGESKTVIFQQDGTTIALQMLLLGFGQQPDSRIRCGACYQ